MKKKPPPGATLIARLKEQRLAREAELAARQNGSTAEAQPGAPAQEQSATVSEPLFEDAAEAPAAVTAIVVDTEPHHAPATAITASAHNLLHRQIDIDDLRPVSDDYQVLTDEIRLAGRFAAAGLIAQGLRLWRLKDAQIYKDHYPTFEDYCRKEHQMSATYAYRLIRMAEMAEQVAHVGKSPLPQSSDGMPDPFEVLISLGHRHLMALLPLQADAAQELLLKGVPVSSDNGQDERVPISRATEKQIREALKTLLPAPTKAAVKVEKRALVSEKQLIPALSKLVEMLEDWALWLDGEPPAELEAARMGRGQLLNRLAKRFRTASGKIADALEGGDET